MLNKILQTLNGHGSAVASLEAALVQLARDRDDGCEHEQPEDRVDAVVADRMRDRRGETRDRHREKATDGR